MATVLVSGAVANKPLNGGEAWVRLSWVLGLQRLGCDVFFVEQIDGASCVDGEGAPTDFERSVNRAYFDSVVERFGLAGRAALLYEGGRSSSGLDVEEVADIARSSDLLVNISGHLKVEALTAAPRVTAYVDLDPGFTQIWHASGTAGARLEGHDYYFTVGENIGTPASPIPTDGLAWRPVRPPVVLDEWPRAPGERERFTTIATWRSGFGRIEYGGTTYGLKVHEFRKVIELPERVPASFEVALDIHPGDSQDRDALAAHGWRIVDPRDAAADPDRFRSYVQGSGAEFSVAQGVYVEARTGWFSDRTVRYLASGKPALVQDTGFTGNYPTGEGLLAFSTLEEAVEGALKIEAAYEEHSKAARELAERYFDSDGVLARFLDETIGSPR